MLGDQRQPGRLRKRHASRPLLHDMRAGAAWLHQRGWLPREYGALRVVTTWNYVERGKRGEDSLAERCYRKAIFLLDAGLRRWYKGDGCLT